MALLHSVTWALALRGDGTWTKVDLSIAKSPAFAGQTHLDGPRLATPSGVEVTNISAGPGHYLAPMIPRQHTHRPMIDGFVDVDIAVHNQDGSPMLRADGAPEVVTIKRPSRVEGPLETVTVEEPGEPPPLPKVTAEVSSNGILHLTFDPAIEDGAQLGVVGLFHYDLGAQ